MDRHARYGRLCWGERIDYSLQVRAQYLTQTLAYNPIYLASPFLHPSKPELAVSFNLTSVCDGVVVQEKEIEITNEYIFALGAHVLYWASKDLSNFLLLQIKKYQDERPEDEAEHREGKGFEREEEEEGEGEGEGRPTVK